MGLLDEAIREHLELKRRRGADPGEIAREEREALDPVFPEDPRPATPDEEPHAVLADPEPPQGDPLAEAAAEPALHDAVEEPPPAIGEETAELDMEAVLDQDERLANETPRAQDQPPAPHAEAGFEDELLEWETSDREDRPPPEPLPGQERLSFE